MILIIGQHADGCAGPQIAEVVAVDVGKFRFRQIPKQHHIGHGVRRRRLIHKTRTCDRDGFLRKQPRQFVDACRELNPSFSLGRNIFEELRVLIQFAAQPDDADRDAQLPHFVEKANVIARLFRVSGVCKQNDMPCALVGLLDHVARRTNAV